MTKPFTHLPKARTTLLRSLQKAFHLAVVANKPDAPTAEELAKLATSQPRRDFLAATAKLGVLVGAGGLLAACEKVAPEPA
ncbi:hypothetical protein, partial [Hymenobacter agri]